MALIQWKYPLLSVKKYYNVAGQTSETYSRNNPNDINTNHTHNVDASLVWRIDGKQTLYSNISCNWLSDKQLTKTNGWQTYYDATSEKITNSVCDYFNIVGTHNRSLKSRGYVVYTNSISQALNIHASIEYEGMWGKASNFFSDGSGMALSNWPQALSNWPQALNKYRNRKDNLNAEVDLTLSIGNGFSVNTGYLGFYTKYRTKDSLGISTISQNRNVQNCLFAFMDYQPSPKVFLHIGSGLTNTHMSGADIRRSKWLLTPQVSINYMPSENVQLSFDYQTKKTLPKLNQLSRAMYHEDAWLVSVGNPNLKEMTERTVSLQSSFFNQLTFGVTYTKTKNDIGEWYEMTGEASYSHTYTNMTKQDMVFYLSHNWKITPALSWKNTVVYNYVSVKLPAIDNGKSNWSAMSNLSLWSAKAKCMFSLEYWRQLVEEPSLQGFSSYGQDLWQLSVNRSFWKRKASVSLSYVPPIHSGVRKYQRSVVATGFLNKSIRQDLRSYDNTILLRVTFHLSNKKKMHNHPQPELHFVDETPKDKGLL